MHGADAVGAALGAARAGRDVAEPHARSRAMRCSTRARLVRTLQLVTRRMVTISRNLLLVCYCECRLRADTRDQPPTAAKGAPESPEGAAHGPHRPGRHRSRAHGDRGAAHYPAADVTAGRGFPGPGTLARGSCPWPRAGRVPRSACPWTSTAARTAATTSRPT